MGNADSTLPSDTMQVISELLAEISQLSQKAWGYYLTKIRHSVVISDPNVRQEVQRELTHAVSLTAIAHIVSVIEGKIPEKYWGLLLDEEESLKLRAYRHLKYCILNGFTGERAEENYGEFEASNAMNLLGAGITTDDNKIFLSEAAALDFQSFAIHICQKMAVRAHNLGHMNG